jgi:hypothetical protein
MSTTDFKLLLPTFYGEADAKVWMEGMVNDPCINNERFAYIEDHIALVEYYDRQEQGCCGSFDADIIVDGRLAIIGCNYGH